MNARPSLHFQELHLPFRATVRHASASRKVGESVWIEASRDGISGYGEGCPRPYVTGETVKSCMAWYQAHISQIEAACTSLEALKEWVFSNATELDANPSAWCAIESALLDLFAREQHTSVEELLGLKKPQANYGYTAIMGDDEEWKYRVLLDMYLVKGFRDFKIKLNGDLERDKTKLLLLKQHAIQHGITGLRIRLDANNLWHANPGASIDHLRTLDASFFAIEEPVMPKDANMLSKISLALDKPVILDESLCTVADLEAYDSLEGRFIANIKVSRVGGVLRALQLVNALHDRKWKIIVGAHVGETSVLTRAAMCVAQAAGDLLIAQEGGFGTKLLEYDTAQPSLSYGHKGMLDLTRPYAEKTIHGLRVTSPDIWNTGWGLDCHTPQLNHPNEADIRTLTMPDGYKMHYRVWGPDEGRDVVLVLHGGMSHSGWQEPLARAFRQQTEITVVAPDRRGCGLNANKGDLGSVQLVIDDVINHVKFLNQSFERVHLTGWCQGAQYASIAAEQLQETGLISSLLLITPGFFWNERFRSVIDNVKMSIDRLVDNFELTPDRDYAFAPVPLEEADFTISDSWLDYIRNDPHKTTEMSLKSVFIMDEIQEMSWFAIPQITVPIYATLATNDRIVDNRKVQEYLTPVIASSAANQLTHIETGHAVQFEKPGELVSQLNAFLASIEH